MYFWHILWFLTCIVEIPLFLASSTNPRIFFWIWKNHFVCKSEWNSKWTTLSWSSFARNSSQYIFLSCSLYMLASHADGLRGSSPTPNAWRNPKNVCVGGYIYVFEKKKNQNINHSRPDSPTTLSLHPFHPIIKPEKSNYGEISQERRFKGFKGGFPISTNYSLRKQKTFTHVHVNKIEAIHEVSRCVYVYSRSSMHCLCFIYARKIYLRTHVNWLDSVNPPYKGIREKEKHHFHRYPFTTHQLLFESFTSFLWLVKLKLHVLGFIFWLKISKLPTSI